MKEFKPKKKSLILLIIIQGLFLPVALHVSTSYFANNELFGENNNFKRSQDDISPQKMFCRK